MADLIRHMEEGHETADIDGVIDEVAEARGTYDSLDDRLDAMGDAPSPSSSTPAMDGTGAAGTADTFARGDHVHPTDTSRQAALTTAQLAAVNSGIDSTKVAQIETNKNNILSLSNTNTVEYTTSAADTYETVPYVLINIPNEKTITITASGNYNETWCKGIQILFNDSIIAVEETSTARLSVATTATFKNSTTTTGSITIKAMYNAANKKNKITYTYSIL